MLDLIPLPMVSSLPWFGLRANRSGPDLPATNNGLLCSRIPAELYRPIIDFADRATLYSLLVTCRAFQREVEQALYRKFDNNEILAQSSFLRAVIACPRLAQHVQIYSFWPEVDLPVTDPLWKALSLGLRAFINLRELSFSTYLGIKPAVRILNGCTFQLEHLAWGCRDDEYDLTKFLATQRRLRRLDVVWRKASSNFPPLAIPGLNAFTGNTAAALTFLPGRKVSRLFWVGEQGNETQPHSRLLKSLDHLRILSFHCDSYNLQPLFSTIASTLHNLEILELIGPSNDDIGSVSRIPSLRKLVISPRYNLPVPSDCFHSLFSQNPLLERVDRQVPGSQSRPFCWYHRWERNAIGPYVVQRAEVLWWYDSELDHPTTPGRRRTWDDKC